METDVYQCPHCGVTIPNKQEKVVLHRIFCKSSYENFSEGNLLKKSTMAGIFELVNIDLKDFPWGVIVRKSKNGETTITYTPTKIYWPVLGINVTTLCCVFIKPVPLYLKILCLVASGITLFAFLCNVIYNRFGRWVLIVKDGKGTFFSGIGKFGRTVPFEYNNDSTVSAATQEEWGPRILQSVRDLPTVFSNIPVFVISHLAGWVLEDHFVQREGITVTANSVKYTFGGTIPNSDVIKYMAAYLLREAAK